MLATVARCAETWLLATGVRCEVQMLTFISSVMQAVRSQVCLLLLQDFLQESCEGWSDLGL